MSSTDTLKPAADRRIERIAIVGGGTAGWMAASVLARMLGGRCAIELIESADIGIVGVGEATIPPIIDFLRFLGIDQNNFVEQTQATYKLGIAFRDWRRQGHQYWHPFGLFGPQINRLPFYHYWHKAKAQGLAATVDAFSVETAFAEANKFIFPQNTLGIARDLRYALHFDAALVARYLRGYAEHLGVVRLERKVVAATQREDGFIDELVFESGDRLRADFYIDCSGFRGLLIEETLKTGYEAWSRYLPCDRAVAMPTEIRGPRTPYTLSTARPAGWQWRIPLQHRIGNGYVYCSQFLNDDEAARLLLGRLDGAPRAEPRPLKFTAGRRKQTWIKNCVALGLASGFLEPLESTSIHLIQSALARLLFLFPGRGYDAATLARYNALAAAEMEEIRDFLLLHYKATERTDTPFWQHCRAIPLTPSLEQRWAMYRENGNIVNAPGDLFKESSWFAVFTGQGVRPATYHPFADLPNAAELQRRLDLIRGDVLKRVQSFPTHDEYLRGMR